MNSKLTPLVMSVLLTGCVFGSGEPSRPSGTDPDTGMTDTQDSERDAGGNGDVRTDMAPDSGRDTGDACGDGVRQPNEQCDPSVPANDPGACPTSCDDGLVCTEDVLYGSADNCDAVCTNTPVSDCVDGDGCCPGGCNLDNDDDCSEEPANCGDGVVTMPETCDKSAPVGDPGRCATSPADCPAQLCRTAQVTGNAQQCNAMCEYSTIILCISDDGCCPTGCDLNNDNDCAAVCDNGAVEPPEICDGNCPTSCPTDTACTSYTLSGSATTCDAECVTTTIDMCIDGDGCCPAVCDNTNDDDCSATCGDDTLDPGETCDGDCPSLADCDDGNACTINGLAGSAANCTAECTTTNVTSCTNGDGCCAPGCNATNDNDCAAICGNNTVESGETCDGNCPTICDDGIACTTDSLSGTSGMCNVTCDSEQIVTCTHGDGCCASGCNANNDDDCPPFCGNSVVEATETCDGNCAANCNDGNACTTDLRMGNAASCNVVCSHPPVTACSSGDGCCPMGCTSQVDSDCGAVCGNGMVESGEECDGNCPQSQAACTACETFTGDPNNCSARCAPIANCVLCTETNCTCGDTQACQAGRCVDTSGTECSDACDSTTYCEAFNGTGFYCVGDGCVQCLDKSECAPVQWCNTNNRCRPAPSCAAANDPDAWCVGQGNGTDTCVNNVCRKSCTVSLDCGPLDVCLNGYCEEAATCGGANNPNQWCVADTNGMLDTCVGNQCRKSCTGPCECPDPANEICDGNTVSMSSESFPPDPAGTYCQPADTTQSKTCTGMCPANADAWCSANFPGTTCTEDGCM